METVHLTVACPQCLVRLCQICELSARFTGHRRTAVTSCFYTLLFCRGFTDCRQSSNALVGFIHTERVARSGCPMIASRLPLTYWLVLLCVHTGRNPYEYRLALWHTVFQLTVSTQQTFAAVGCAEFVFRCLTMNTCL